jgi:crotonobetainyl-CoA:carnitine CoA-transferase CaiB-like acyl-CoA transferase
LCRLERLKIGAVEVRELNPKLIDAQITSDAEMEKVANAAPPNAFKTRRQNLSRPARSR